VPGRTNSFIDRFLADDVSLTWIVGPWLMMSIGMIVWLILNARKAEPGAQGN
jgi:hypothetical protein